MRLEEGFLHQVGGIQLQAPRPIEHRAQRSAGDSCGTARRAGPTPAASPAQGLGQEQLGDRVRLRHRATPRSGSTISPESTSLYLELGVLGEGGARSYVPASLFRPEVSLLEKEDDVGARVLRAWSEKEEGPDADRGRGAMART